VSLSPSEYIRHMLEEIDYILSRISDTDYESFVRDETLKRAFVRSVEIIGEASKKLPEDIKAKQQDVEVSFEFEGKKNFRHQYLSRSQKLVWYFP